MHSFAHAFHAISDINVQVGQRGRRLTSEAIVLRQPIPMQVSLSLPHLNILSTHIYVYSLCPGAYQRGFQSPRKPAN